MASSPTEASPLLGSARATTTSLPESRPARTVTFDPNIKPNPSSGPSSYSRLASSRHASLPAIQSGSSGQPVLAALNSKLRRRHSQEAPYRTGSNTVPAQSKIGPQRTSKNTQKLKLLPNPVTGEEDELTEEEVPTDVYSQIKRIKEPTARRDAARLGKADRDRLPRVTAYCTAGSYRLDGVMRYLKARAADRGANPKLFDECVYSPYNYDHKEKLRKLQEQQQHLREEQLKYGGQDDLPNQIQQPMAVNQLERRFSDSELEVDNNKKQQRQSLIELNSGADPDAQEGQHGHQTTLVSDDRTQSTARLLSPGSTTPPAQADLDFNTTIDTPEIFLFDYGTVVIWGMTPKQEAQFLHEVSKFADSVLSAEDMQVENFNFYYTRDYQARIYNDFISLRDPKSYMTKLAISHALSQSVKTSLFEDLVSETIAATSPLPAQIAQTGSVNLTRRQINMQIGELFILRINIHLQGSVLDSPELMWSEPQLDPVYQAVRSYLEMDQRVGLLTERLEVIADLLAVLKDQLSHRHGEYLEWIVIILIAAEIVIAAINIVVDLYAGFD
ncbi:hypothetical protein VTO42DRAFT_8023 [Malbranchea cinnamomea]